ncbi:hypothetical protein HJFPF1_09580 [Paramyrothecium foliicola]|nr:hypothetical protein HJFPF1_09580 [Paramyrothecium foliicola]
MREEVIACEANDADYFVGRIKFPAEFMFTIGAPGEVLGCIARITRFWHRPPEHKNSFEIESLAHDISGRLFRHRRPRAIDFFMGNPRFKAPCCDSKVVGGFTCFVNEELVEEPSNSYGEAQIQAQALMKAVHIYLDRSIDMEKEIFDWRGNFSLWPAFIAAVEATTPSDMAAASRWLNWAVSFGIGIGKNIKTFVQEVWR